MTNTDLSVLEKLGIGPRSARVYLALIQLGQCHIRDLAVKTGMVRQLIYESMTELEEAGLAHRVTSGKNRFMYLAAPPAIITEKLRDEVREAEKLEEKLSALYKTALEVPQMTLYSGWNAIRGYWREFGKTKMHANIPDESISATEEWYAADYDFMEKFWEPNKVERGIKTRLLAPSGWIAEIQSKRQNYEVRLLPKDPGFHGDITIYGDTVHFLALGKADSYMSVITSPQIAASMHSVFEMIWVEAKKSTPSVDMALINKGILG